MTEPIRPINPIRPSRIAVVDDDAFMVTIVSALLRRSGAHDVTGFDDACAACSAITAPEAAFDVVILDLNMPGMDGFEFFHGLAQAKADCALILFSGESDDMVRSAERIAVEHGLRVAGHLPKPPTPAALEALLRRAGEQHIVASVDADHFGADELLAAIAAGELFCLYQPVVDLRSAKVFGADVRLRWNHPQYGALGPDAFMRVARHNGMGALLTREALDLALAAQRRWRDAGFALRIAVRVDAQALDDADFPDHVAECCARHGADAQSVVLRLRTADVAAPGTAVLEALARLRLRKFELALDDFGSGDLSLLRLDELGLAALRVSPAALERARTGATAARALEACAAVASVMRMRAVIGGVASDADWALCRNAGYALGDGPAFSAPLAADALAAWLSSGQQPRAPR